MGAKQDHWSEQPPRFAVRRVAGFGDGLWVSKVTALMTAKRLPLSSVVGRGSLYLP
jgi:hypothetical protein